MAAKTQAGSGHPSNVYNPAKDGGANEIKQSDAAAPTFSHIPGASTVDQERAFNQAGDAARFGAGQTIDRLKRTRDTRIPKQYGDTRQNLAWARESQDQAHTQANLLEGVLDRHMVDDETQALGNVDVAINTENLLQGHRDALFGDRIADRTQIAQDIRDTQAHEKAKAQFEADNKKSNRKANFDDWLRAKDLTDQFLDDWRDRSHGKLDRKEADQYAFGRSQTVAGEMGFKRGIAEQRGDIEFKYGQDSASSRLERDIETGRLGRDIKGIQDRLNTRLKDIDHYADIDHATAQRDLKTLGLQRGQAREASADRVAGYKHQQANIELDFLQQNELHKQGNLARRQRHETARGRRGAEDARIDRMEQDAIDDVNFQIGQVEGARDHELAALLANQQWAWERYGNTMSLQQIMSGSIPSGTDGHALQRLLGSGIVPQQYVAGTVGALVGDKDKYPSLA